MSSDFGSFAFGRTSEKPNATVSDITYVPQCTSSSVATYDGYSLNEAKNFDLRSWDYYKGLLPAAIGGWVAAGICLLLALLFLIWLVAVCACKCCCGQSRGGGKKHRRQAATAGIWQDHNHNPAKGFQRFTAKHTTCSAILCTLIVLLLLATLGLGAWGLYEGLNAVNDLSTNFFKVLDTAQVKVENLQQALGNFSVSAQRLQTAITALSAALSGINLTSLQQELNMQLDLTGLVTKSVREGLDAASKSVARLAKTSTNVARQVQKDGVKTIANIQAKESTFDAVQNKWVPLGLGLLFAILAVLAIIAVVLLLIRRVRCGAFFLTLLWIWTALWFFVGPGLLHFATEFTSDTCLYPEHFVFQTVNESNSFSNSTKESVNTGLLYYFGAFGPNVTFDDVIQDIYGLDISGVTTLANSSIIDKTVRDLSNEAAQALLKVPLKTTSEQQQELSRAPQTLENLITGYNDLQRQMSRSNFDELYLSAKTLLCCQLGNSVRRAWIAWTAAAATAGVLCLVLTLRTFQVSRWKSKEPDSEEYIVGRGASDPTAPPYSTHGSEAALTQSMTLSDKRGGPLEAPWPHRPAPSEVKLTGPAR